MLATAGTPSRHPASQLPVGELGATTSAKSEICGDREIRTEENRRTSRRSACELGGIVAASRTYPGRSVGRSKRPTSPVSGAFMAGFSCFHAAALLPGGRHGELD